MKGKAKDRSEMIINIKKTMIWLCALIVFNFCATATVHADELSDLKEQFQVMQRQMQEQARQMEEMRRKIEKLEAGKPAEAKKRTYTLHSFDTEFFKTYYKDGLRLETEDKKFSLRVGGRVQADFAWMEEESNVKKNFGGLMSPAEFRRLRIYTLGTIYEDCVYKLQVDFASGTVGLRDAYVGVQNVPYLGLVRVGQFTEPFSLEDMTSSNHITFLERSLPYALSVHRNTGIGFNSNPFDGRVTFSAAAFYNADDQGVPITNAGNAAVRLTGLPWYEDGGKRLLHLGVAYCYRSPTVDKSNFSYSSEPDIHLAPDFVNTGNFPGRFANLLGLEAALVNGPFSMQGEFMQSFVDMKNASSPGYFEGFYATASYFLTGEHRNYNKFFANFSGTEIPDYFSMKNRTFGALEIAVRYSYLDFNSKGVYGGVMSDITVGLNWYLNNNIKVMFNYVHAHPNGVGDADIIAARCQAAF
jgi:phosphate-selective porin OprO/OprP